MWNFVNNMYTCEYNILKSESWKHQTNEFLDRFVFRIHKNDPKIVRKEKFKVLDRHLVKKKLTLIWSWKYFGSANFEAHNKILRKCILSFQKIISFFLVAWPVCFVLNNRFSSIRFRITENTNNMNYTLL